MTLFFYVLEGFLIIIIKTHDFILALLVARTHMARQSVMSGQDLLVMKGLSLRQRKSCLHLLKSLFGVHAQVSSCKEVPLPIKISRRQPTCLDLPRLA